MQDPKEGMYLRKIKKKSVGSGVFFRRKIIVFNVNTKVEENKKGKVCK